MSLNSKIISIEGNIGSGKSSLLEKLEKHENLNILQERVEDWN